MAARAMRLTLGMLVCVAACGRIAFDPLAERDASTSTGDGDGSTAPGDGSADASFFGCVAPPCGGTATFGMCNGRCFSHCTDIDLQDEATNRCAVWGGTIATIHSQTDNDCVVAMAGSIMGWIGYMQAMGATTLAGNWSWLDGVPSPYLNWGAAEPQDVDNVEDGTEQCAVMFGDGTWADTPCANLGETSCSK